MTTIDFSPDGLKCPYCYQIKRPASVRIVEFSDKGDYCLHCFLKECQKSHFRSRYPDAVPFLMERCGVEVLPFLNP